MRKSRPQPAGRGHLNAQLLPFALGTPPESAREGPADTRESALTRRCAPPRSANAQVSSRTRTSQPRVRLETCALARIGREGRVPGAPCVSSNSCAAPAGPSEAGIWRPGGIAPPRRVSRRPHPGSPSQGRPHGGAHGTPGTIRGGQLSKSVAKAPRTGIGREKKRGISTILLRRRNSIRAFATDLDKRRPSGAPEAGSVGPIRPMTTAAHPPTPPSVPDRTRTAPDDSPPPSARVALRPSP